MTSRSSGWAWRPPRRSPDVGLEPPAIFAPDGRHIYFTRNTTYLSQRLAALHGLQSNETLVGWQAQVAAGEWPQLVEELLTLHYDPLYRRSQATHYAGQPDSPRYASDDLSPAGIEQLALAIVQGRKAHTA